MALDYMGSTELIANLFRISQTEEKLRKDAIQGAEETPSVHYNVGKEVRSAIEKIGGTMPEDMKEKKIGLNIIMKHYSEKDNWEFPTAMLQMVRVYRMDVQELSCKAHE